MLIFFIFFYYVLMFCCFFFFFSSRRRHTRWNCDWSSDVCSSDLSMRQQVAKGDLVLALLLAAAGFPLITRPREFRNVPRSEERRVGKECRSRWWRYH